MKKLLFFILLLSVSITIHSQGYAEWTGFGDGESWDDPFNWDRDGEEEVPQYGDFVVIDDGFVMYSGDGNVYDSVELTGGTNLLIQSDLNCYDFYVDTFSTLTVDLNSLNDYSKVICDYYYIVGLIDLLFSNYVPQIGNSYQIIQGEQNFCSINTVEFVSDGEATGFEVTLAVQCQTDGILHTVTGINYTTAKYWTGAGGNNSWQTAANWNNGQLPDASSNVIINLPSGATVSTNGAGTTSIYSMSIGENNTLVVNGNLEMFSSIKNNETGTIIWNGGTISKTSSPVTSALINDGTIEMNTESIKTIGNGFEIWNSGIINHNQGNLNIDNGQVVDFSNSEYNINGDNITIGYSNGSVGSHSFFHLEGSVLRKSAGSGTSSINLPGFIAFVTSSIISEQGILAFGESITNYGSLIGSGSFQMPTGYVEIGNIAPGASPGTLTFVGDLNTGAAADFNIEIDGSNAGTQYDQIIVSNSAMLEGTINVTLGYLPLNNASFEILKAGTLTNCNFPSQITANYNGTDYTFNVVCQNDILFLNGPGVVLSTKEEVLNSFSIFPNPTNDYIHIKLNNDLFSGEWKLFNQLGQEVLNGRIEESITKVDLKNINKGMYFLKINDEQSSNLVVRKVIVSN